MPRETPNTVTPTAPHKRLRARGSASNDAGRFEAHTRQADHDGWDIPEEDQLVRTTVSDEVPRKIITRNGSPDIAFDRSINPYRGCEHGCSYCFARPTHAYLGLSPGLDFETRLIARPTAPQVLAAELRAKSYKVAPIAIGTNTDPYQPIERDRRIMRGILQVLADHRHPVTIVTKGALIARDIDILSDMAAQGLTHVGISVTTLDPDLSRRLEPRAAAPATRLRIIEQLAQAGIPVRAMIAPVIPALTDHELEAILAAVAKAGARSAGYILLRLPLEVAPLFRDWLTRHAPDRAARVMGRIRETQGGQDYDPEWGKRMTGAGAFADLTRARFKIALKRNGLDNELPRLRTDLFRLPPRVGDQLDLFGPQG